MFVKVSKKEFLQFVKSRDFTIRFEKQTLPDNITCHLGKYIDVAFRELHAFEVFRFSDGRRNEYYVRTLLPDNGDSLQNFHYRKYIIL